MIRAEMLEEAAATGGARCDQMSESNTSAIEDATLIDFQKLFDQQLSTMNPEAMRHCYVELLRRSDALLKFMFANVGNNQDWPIIFIGETKETVEMLRDKIAELRDAVGCLKEV